MSLKIYKSKRHFDKTSEPQGKIAISSSGRLYVIQKHAASHLHYDFRLEMAGVLKSWAIPKGPSLNPADKRLAVQVEDHPIQYGRFEGVIPSGEYGAGVVMLWDRGQWEPIGDAEKSYQQGSISFYLQGEKLKGLWKLIRLKNKQIQDEKNWLLVKQKDEAASIDYDVTRQMPLSILTGRNFNEIKNAKD